MALKFDSTISLGSVATLITILGTIGVAYSQNNERLAKTEQKIESLQTAEQRRDQEIRDFKQELKLDISEIKRDLKDIGKAVKVN
jgi:hypothetical protein